MRRLLLLAALAAGVGLMFAFGGGLTRIIESQIFFPDQTLVATPAQAGLAFEDVDLTTSDGLRLHGWFIPGPDPAAPVVLFCHGNAGNISHRLDNLKRLHQAGLASLIFDYRGYGRSQGRPSEAGLYLDAEAAYGWAKARAEAGGARLILFGRSLGGVAAVHLAERFPCAGAILESTFTHLGDMAVVHFPFIPARALKDRFSSLSRIGRVSAPLLFFHGDRDRIVPLRLGQQLFEAAPEPKEFVLLEGADHNDTYLKAGPPYFAKFAAFCRGN